MTTGQRLVLTLAGLTAIVALVLTGHLDGAAVPIYLGGAAIPSPVDPDRQPSA
jgi:hypothetical protein